MINRSLIPKITEEFKKKYYASESVTNYTHPFHSTKAISSLVLFAIVNRTLLIEIIIIVLNRLINKVL